VRFISDVSNRFIYVTGMFLLVIWQHYNAEGTTLRSDVL